MRSILTPNRLLMALAASALAALLTPAGAHAQNTTQDSAQKLYTQNCASCHGDSGKGDGPAAAGLMPKPKPFQTALKGKTDAWIANVIKNGGPAVGESPIMPPLPSASEAQIDQLVAYIKKL